MSRRRYYMPLTLPLLTYLWLVETPAVVWATTDPVEAKWSPNAYGPDGPWPAVEVLVGGDQKIALYPGREFETYLLTTDYCTFNASVACQAAAAGLYNMGSSTRTATGSTGGVQYQAPPNYMLGLPVKSHKNLTHWVDKVDFQEGSGPVPNVSMALLAESFASYPGGQWYPLTVGCLGLGAPETVNQTFSSGSASVPSKNASLVPGNLFERGRVESNSFGMHIGSAAGGSSKVPGALHFGGYDRNRVVGKILTSSGDYNRETTLKDIAIRVVDGSSPWSFGAAQEGLLAQGNSSMGSNGIYVHVDGCSPYLSLPKSTCDAIAQHLPVTYNEGLGLYTWNTDDAKYTQIVNSASALEFSFYGSSNTDKVPISVPFRHLNLTLDAPLVSSPRPYFPCFTGSDTYTLGRAFLQDAFVGANWGAKTWFMAQAPGPNIPPSNVVKFAGGDAASITASKNDWKESWTTSWKALTPAEAGGSTAVAPPNGADPNNSNSNSNSNGLSTGGKAGIGVGVGVGALAVIAACAFLWFRHRQWTKKGVTEGSNFNSSSSNNNNNYNAMGSGAPLQGYYKPDSAVPYNPSAHDSTAYSGSDARYSTPNSQYPPHAYAASELPSEAYVGAPSELPTSPPTTFTGTGSLQTHGTSVQ
ncbi:hypothetical protein PG993_004372 [Apiospora rasikravindrae]|uniref:Peptidase A1 domain-containing protein n=1 Tax=Apiospora rasikravindrae TaxID=990691 RepID=A0ABR1TCN2_9PEZI